MSQPHSPPTLLVKAPHGDTRIAVLSHTPFTLGRSRDNDLCLEETAVSARHARIVPVQGVLFIEDMGSMSGTFVNDQRIVRRQLHHGDRLRLGTHRLIFRQEQRTAAESAPGRAAPVGAAALSLPRRPEEPAPVADRHIGIVEILSGHTGQSQYRLTGPISLIGAQDDAVITLTGWFAPKTAAVINRKGESYLVSQTESGKRILINGRVAQGAQALRHGDVLEVAGITMRFLLRDRNAASPNI